MLTQIVSTAMWAMSWRYWFREGTLDEAIIEARKYTTKEAQADAIEYVLMKNAFVCNFDDPCDEWEWYPLLK